MHIATIDNVSKSFGIRTLFKDLTFHIEQGNKLALVAPNGAGKSSLLKIISQKDTPTTGTVWVHKDVKVVLMPQEADMDLDKNIWDNIFKSDIPALNSIKKYEQLIEEGKEASQDFFDVLEEMETYNAWEAESVVKEILGKLQIDHLEQTVDRLSGGQKKRVALAQALIESALYGGDCLLILDEPTNHLDVNTIEWLEDYLGTQKTTLLLVTHDRWFLETICNVILEIDQQKLYRHEGNYDYYLQQKAHRYEIDSSELQKDKNLFKKELEWMRKQPKARTTKSKSREDNFYEIKERASQKKVENQLTLEVAMNRLGGKIVELKKVYKNIGNVVVTKGFDYTFSKGERIGIIGKNGVGKSTFLKMLLGLIEADSGKVVHGETIVFGHYNQDGLEYKNNIRAIDHVKEIAEYFPLADGTKLSASVFMERFGFTAEQQYTYLDSLSGGEKRRLHLMEILFKNPNFLVLDEPTNDLDLQTLRIVEEFLAAFGGCLIMVSHDRYFMDRLVDHLFCFNGDGEIKDFPGNYAQYRLWLEEEKKGQTSVIKPTTIVGKIDSPKTGKRKLSFNEKREFETIEQEMADLETEKIEIEKILSSGENDFEKITKASNRITAIIQLIETKEMRWLELSEIAE